MESNERGLQKSEVGRVVSAKMAKTVVVAVVRQIKHPTYGKYVKKTQKYFAHDESLQCKVGDTVKIVEGRPLSRWKRWRVRTIVSQANS